MRILTCICLASLALASCKKPEVAEETSVVTKPPIVLPPAPDLTEEGHDLLLSSGGRSLILDYETGGKSEYNPHPEWPKGNSGTTVGIGYDCGFYSKTVILNDWHSLILRDKSRLSDTSGITGQRAATRVRELQDINIQWLTATDVFDNVDVAREFASAKRAMPGFDDLRPNAQAAIVSLGFNRGWGMSGPNRVEFRAIRDLVPSRDYGAMAVQFRKMIHIWIGTSIERGMTRRRYAEAKLIETP